MQYEVRRLFNDSIMLLSFPSLPYLPWTSTKNPKSQYPTDEVKPWCLSHWPGANCFITHYCSSHNQKKKLITLHDLPKLEINMMIVDIDGGI
jgi:hypothetical protein